MILSASDVMVYLQLSAPTAAQTALMAQVVPFADRLVKTYLQSEVEQATYVEYLPADWRIGARDTLLNDYQMRGSYVTMFANRRAADALILKHLPVRNDSTLEVREMPNAFAAQAPSPFPTALIKGTDYWLDVDQLGATQICRTGKIRRNGAFPSDPRSVKVTYNGGWSPTELATGEAAPIRLACIIAAAKLFKEAVAQKAGKVGPIISESLGGYSVSYESMMTAMNNGWACDLPVECKYLLQPFRSYGRLQI